MRLSRSYGFFAQREQDLKPKEECPRLVRLISATLVVANLIYSKAMVSCHALPLSNYFSRAPIVFRVFRM